MDKLNKDDERLFLGVDFDGTIVEEAFPSIGKINHKVVELMALAKAKGHVVIVWTARSGKYEQEAREFLDDNNIPYNFINENPEDSFAQRGEQGRKLFCHYYIDDRAVHVSDIQKVFDILHKDEVTKKAKLNWTFSLAEDECENNSKVFNQGDIVEVIREVRKERNMRQFLIYNEKINESTVVCRDLLEFI